MQDTSAHTVWMTYAELAARLDITGPSVRNLVRRREWPRKPGNDGTMRVAVPLEYLAERDAEEKEATMSSDEAAIVAAIARPIEPPVEVDTMAATVAAMEGHIATLQGVVEHERQRADKEHERADAERERAADERDRADKERDRADALVAELEKLQADTSRQAATAQAKAVENVEASVAALRALVDKMQQSAGVPPWLRWATGRSGRAS